jgi:hypothetical protein
MNLPNSLFLGAALRYAEKGLSVIPCKPDKTPFIPWKPYQTNKATPEEIRNWWVKWPEAMIGIVTGEISGLLVIDADNDEARRTIQDLLPDGLVIPIAKTPRGWHYYFLYPVGAGLTSGAGVLPGVDFRGNGGYIIAPPSKREGGTYAWLPGLSIDEVAPTPTPDAIINIINNSIYRGGVVNDENKTPQMTTKTTSDHKLFENGTRDNDLFHTANCLVKGGMLGYEIRQVLEKIIISWGENPDRKWIDTKVGSALKRAESRERNIAAEVREWVLTTTGHFLTTDNHKELELTTSDHKKAANMALLRLCEGPNPILEKYGDRRGCFRRIETDLEPVNFLTAPTAEFPVIWPMGLHDLCSLYPGNIVIVAGSKSSGKTAFMLNIVKMNMDKVEVVYLNSEMGDTEFRNRLELFKDVKLNNWNFKPYHRACNFADLITPERKIFIIDFLEVTTDFWKVAQYIQEIHRKLKEGLCIIAIQKADNKDTGRGGDFSKEKARLYLSLDYIPESKTNQIKIVDAKAWKDGNPRGKYRRYKLANGSKFLPIGEWND